jgi:hypothetical protein
MRLHDRTLPVQAAGAELFGVLEDFQSVHDLTDVEMLRLLHEHGHLLTKRLLRAERHPRQPGKKADEA